MDESASRRHGLRNMTVLGAASGVSVALAADVAGAQQSLAQAQPAVPARLTADSARFTAHPVDDWAGHVTERGQGPDGFAALPIER